MQAESEKSMDYIDAMVEAREKELSLWMFKYGVNRDAWEYYRDGVLMETKTDSEFLDDHRMQGEIDHFNKLRDRAAMNAVFVVVEKHLLHGHGDEIKLLPCWQPSPVLKRFVEMKKQAQEAITKTLGIEDALLADRMTRIEKAAGVTYEEAFGQPKIDWLAINKQASGG